MAADLASTPSSGLTVQLCGDAHLANFGVFASPERVLLFDLNDFDETLPGPFEYDVKRLAASFVIAARNNGFSKADTRAATRAVVTAYRKRWRVRRDGHDGHLVRAHVRGRPDGLDPELRTKSKKATKPPARRQPLTERGLRKARTRDSLQALAKLGEVVDGGTGS